MGFLIAISLVLLLAALAASVLVMRRTGEALMVLGTAGLVALGALEAEAFWRLRGHPLGFDLASGIVRPMSLWKKIHEARS